MQGEWSSVPYSLLPTLERLELRQDEYGSAKAPKGLCKHFMIGRCTYGANCTFSHDAVPHGDGKRRRGPSVHFGGRDESPGRTPFRSDKRRGRSESRERDSRDGDPPSHRTRSRSKSASRSRDGPKTPTKKK